MNADRLLALFEPISEAPDAIPRLRRFILDLAVRGKLVEQDPQDKSVGELLGEIYESMVLSGGRKRKTAKPLTESDDAEPFDIPCSWAWVSLGQITDLITSGSRDWAKHYSGDGAIFVRMGNLSRHHYRLRLDSIQHVKPPAGGEGTRTSLQAWDVLVSITGDVGMLGLIPEEFGEAYINQHTALVRPCSLMKGRFLPEVLRSDFAQDQFRAPQRGIKNSFRLSDVANVLIPLPPLAEQHRIVAKVDELMALCDQLEAARQQREQCRERLVASSLQRLNQPSDEKEDFRSDARFALQVLPSITTTMAQIKQLRQTVLNLAVRGKLVKQDPEDEPAEELLRCIAADRSLMQKTRGRFRNDEIKSISNEAVPYEPPQGWVWARFGNIMYSRDGERVPVSKDERSRRAKIYDYYGASGVIDKIDDFLFDKPLLLIGEDGANLLNRSTPIAFIARGKYWVNNHAHVMDGISEEFLRFIELTINATDLAPYVTGTAQPKMNQAKMNSIPVALPPLAEQHRIVAKVDELMALCDQLEHQLSQAVQSRRGLLEAVLQEALAAPSALLKVA